MSLICEWPSVSTMFGVDKLVRWSEHPVLSMPPVIRGIISTDGSPEIESHSPLFGFAHRRVETGLITPRGAGSGRAAASRRAEF